MEYFSGVKYIRNKYFRKIYLFGWGLCKLVINE